LDGGEADDLSECGDGATGHRHYRTVRLQRFVAGVAATIEQVVCFA
jgi:hypothetical protein